MAERRRTLAGQLLTWYAVTVVVLLTALGISLNQVLEFRLLDDLTESLESHALLLRAGLSDPTEIQDAVVTWARAENLRVTIIDAEGVVLADTSRDPAGMENHAGRPEVQAAVAGRTGVASRVSASVGVEFRYVAVPPTSLGWVVRVAEPVSSISQRLSSLRIAIAVPGLVAALLGVGAVWLVARRIVQPIQEATRSAVRIAAGDPSARMSGTGVVELQRMADTVNQMAAELRRRATASEDERMLRDRILDGLDEGVILVDGDDSIAYANSWASKALGQRRTMTQLPVALQELAELARGGTSLAHRDFDHGIPTRRFMATGVLLDETGSVLLLAQDITEAVRVEAMRRDFVADASHELKTPISAIQAGSETILRAVDNDPDAVRVFAEQVHANSVRLGRLVVDLLDLSRLEAEEMVFERVRLDELVADEVGRLASTSDRVGARVVLEAVPVEMMGSGNDVRLAIRNLLENAYRHAPAGEIRIAVRHEGDEAIFEVADDGEGIPGRDLPRVFERFYRVDSARSRHTGGTGLGLAIVKHVAERHGGTVEAESELGAGSTFCLRLPVRVGPIVTD